MSDGMMTREDLREALRDMTASINRGFDGINDRLDTLNGKTDRHESAIAVHEERWKKLDQATSFTPARGFSKEEAGIKGDWKTLSLLGSLAAGAVSGLIWGVFKVLQVVQMVAGK